MDKYFFYVSVEIHDFSIEKGTKTSDFMISFIQLFYNKIGKYFDNDIPSFRFVKRKRYFEVEFNWSNLKSEGEEQLEHIKKFMNENYSKFKYGDYSEPKYRDHSDPKYENYFEFKINAT